MSSRLSHREVMHSDCSESGEASHVAGEDDDDDDGDGGDDG